MYPYTDENIIIKEITSDFDPNLRKYELHTRVFKFSILNWKYLPTDSFKLIVCRYGDEQGGWSEPMRFDTIDDARNQRNELIENYKCYQRRKQFDNMKGINQKIVK